MQQASKRSGSAVARLGARHDRCCGVARTLLGALVVLILTAIGAGPGAAAAAAAAGTTAPRAPVAASAAASPVQRAPAPASAASDAARQPAPRRTDLVPLAPLVPRLTDADRRAMRLEARALRERAAVPSPAWALVAAPSADRRQSERITARIQAVFGRSSAIPRAETMRSGAAWRAVVWPFRDARDAEQARLALASRGLRTELIEF